MEDLEMTSITMKDMAHIHDKMGADTQKFMGATILVTGCAGFLGYYFMSYFKQYRKELGIGTIIGLDNFMLGRPKWIDDLGEGFTIQNFDVISDDISAIEGASKANYVIHMASIASPVFYRKYPIETLDANIWGLRRLLDYYLSKDIKGILFFSSSEIYGDPTPDAIPTNEEYRGLVSVTGPRACYDEAKRFGETMCALFHQQYNMPIGVARPFNNYGPGMKLNDQRVPADFAHAVSENKDIVILSSGSPTRTFCYVADAIVGYLKILLLGTYDYFNIGIDVPEITVKQLADVYTKAAYEIFSYTGKVVYRSSEDEAYLTHNPQRRCPDIGKARRILGYDPQIRVEDGVRRFLQHIKESRKEETQW
jgi:UDP-glucuronate decarboxylase